MAGKKKLKKHVDHGSFTVEPYPNLRNKQNDVVQTLIDEIERIQDEYSLKIDTLETIRRALVDKVQE